MDIFTTEILQSRQRDENAPECREGWEDARVEVHFTKIREPHKHPECGGMRLTSSPVDAKAEMFEVGKVARKDGYDMLALPP